METNDIITSPLPLPLREPLLLLIDAHEGRHRWVVSLLAFANYHVYATGRPLEAYVWYLEHQMAPQVLLLGQLHAQERFFAQRFWQLMVTRQGKNIPVVSLETYFPVAGARGTPSFSPGARGDFGLLETLWRLVTRRL
ncbi:MAG TPA: hypothetical protein VEL31_27790 [Ktedonobacteraceae bacterium]|nr:hypothetical protein [Ktedonobacteraceae bacterium]